MTNSITDFYDYVIPYVRGASTAVVDLEIRRILRQFFRRTTLLREVLPYTLTPSTSVLTIAPSVGAGAVDLAGVIDVEINGGYQNGTNYFTRILPLPEQAQPRPGWNPSPAQPRGFNFFPPSLVVFSPLPDLPYPVLITVFETMPLDNTNTTYPAVALQYADTVGHGVIAALLAMPGKPWTDLQNAVLYQKLYGERALALRDQLRSGGVRNSSRLTAPRFGV